MSQAAHLSSPVVVSESTGGRYQQTVSAGSHVLISDQPASKGGDDAGLAPYDLLLASLGSCTSMTLRMYAEKKGLTVQQISVQVMRSVEVADDGKTVELITREITIEGDLTVEQRGRMLEIADKCPISRTLKSEFKLINLLADGCN